MMIHADHSVGYTRFGGRKLRSVLTNLEQSSLERYAHRKIEHWDLDGSRKEPLGPKPRDASGCQRGLAEVVSALLGVDMFGVRKLVGSTECESE